MSDKEIEKRRDMGIEGKERERLEKRKQIKTKVNR